MDQNQPPAQSEAPTPPPPVATPPPTPDPAPAAQPPPPPGNPISKNMLFIIFGSIFIIVLIIGSIVVMRQSSRKQPISKLTPSATPTAQTSPAPTANIDLLPSFQEVLNTNCKEVTKDGGTSYQIAKAALPVTLDETVLTIAPKQEDRFYCLFFSPENLSKNYVSIELADFEKINIYDSFSEELGHGGPPFLGSVGKVIKEENGIKYTMLLIGSDGPQLIGQISVAVRGEKRITLANGAPAFVNYEITAIKADDPRLVTLLKQFGGPAEIEPGAMQIVRDGANEAVIEMFFSKPETMATGEKAALEKVAKILNAVKAK